MSFNPLPVVIGVTGHRNIVEEDKPAIRQQVKAGLLGILSFCRSGEGGNKTPVIMLNSLAQGSDMLCAEVAFELNIPVTAVLPCEKERYALSFDEDQRQKLFDYVERADKVIIAPDTEKSFDKINADGQLITPESYEYRQAGLYVAERSQILVALWDGKPPKAEYGCGTVEVIEFALRRNYFGCIEEGRNERAVMWIKCRRQGDGGEADIIRQYLAPDADCVQIYSCGTTIPEATRKAIAEKARYNGKF